MEKFDWLTVAGAEARWHKLDNLHCKHWNVWGEYDPALTDVPNPLQNFDGIFQLTSNPVHWFRPKNSRVPSKNSMHVSPTVILQIPTGFSKGDFVVTKSLLVMLRMNPWELWSSRDMFKVHQSILEGNRLERIQEDLEFAREMMVKIESKIHCNITDVKFANVICETWDRNRTHNKALSGPEVYFNSICGVFRRLKRDFNSVYCRLDVWQEYIHYIGGHTACFLSKGCYKFCLPQTKGFVIEAADLKYMVGIYEKIYGAIPQSSAVDLIFEYLNLGWSLSKIHDARKMTFVK